MERQGGGRRQGEKDHGYGNDDEDDGCPCPLPAVVIVVVAAVGVVVVVVWVPLPCGQPLGHTFPGGSSNAGTRACAVRITQHALALPVAFRITEGVVDDEGSECREGWKLAGRRGRDAVVGRRERGVDEEEGEGRGREEYLR